MSFMDSTIVVGIDKYVLWLLLGIAFIAGCFTGMIVDMWLLRQVDKLKDANKLVGK